MATRSSYYLLDETSSLVLSPVRRGTAKEIRRARNYSIALGDASVPAFSVIANFITPRRVIDVIMASTRTGTAGFNAQVSTNTKYVFDACLEPMRPLVSWVFINEAVSSESKMADVQCYLSGGDMIQERLAERRLGIAGAAQDQSRLAELFDKVTTYTQKFQAQDGQNVHRTGK